MVRFVRGYKILIVFVFILLFILIMLFVGQYVGVVLSFVKGVDISWVLGMEV